METRIDDLQAHMIRPELRFDEAFETFVTKKELAEFKEITLSKFDKVFGFLEKLDQERLFMHQAILDIQQKLAS